MRCLATPGASLRAPIYPARSEASRTPAGRTLSAGWSDVYVADIPCQWIDITGLTDGAYSLRVGVDEQDIIEEASTHPNEATLNVRIQGYSVTVLP